MAFTDYRAIDDVIRKHRIRCTSGRVVTPAADAPPFDDYFRGELDLTLREFPLNRSETGCGELVLFPLLREVWKTYRTALTLFTHEPLTGPGDLTGVPDYFVCQRSEFGPFYPEPPFLLVVEAKLDDFERGWGQCLAEMLAAQHLNGVPDQPVFGITTNGRSWEFGVLRGTDFVQQPDPVALFNLDTLGQALHAVFRACRDLALARRSPAPAAP
jgi:hypothetical protein